MGKKKGKKGSGKKKKGKKGSSAASGPLTLQECVACHAMYMPTKDNTLCHLCYLHKLNTPVYEDPAPPEDPNAKKEKKGKKGKGSGKKGSGKKKKGSGKKKSKKKK